MGKQLPKLKVGFKPVFSPTVWRVPLWKDAGRQILRGIENLEPRLSAMEQLHMPKDDGSHGAKAAATATEVEGTPLHAMPLDLNYQIERALFLEKMEGMMKAMKDHADLAQRSAVAQSQLSLAVQHMVEIAKCHSATTMCATTKMLSYAEKVRDIYLKLEKEVVTLGLLNNQGLERHLKLGALIDLFEKKCQGMQLRLQRVEGLVAPPIP